MSDSKPAKANSNIRPVIYQLIPRLFANYNGTCVPDGSIEQNGSGKMNGINSRILQSIRRLGCTHIWYTGVIEHAHCTDYTDYGITPDNPHVVKGKAGSPYAISDYYDIDPDIAESVPDRIAEFEALVTRTHESGMKVIIDFVPNHVARRYHSDVCPPGIEDLGASDNTDMFFSPSNNFYYIPRQQFSPEIDLGQGCDAYVEYPAKATGNDCFTAFPGRNDWYETVKLNYGYDPGDHSCHFHPIPDTWLKMLNILRYWAAKGVDGFRCDMAHMVPVEFWQWAITSIRQTYPDIIFIAEIYEVGLYRRFIYEGGFDYLYDKVTLYDTLRGIDCCNTSAAQLTSCWQTVDGIGHHMLNFLENHDEQRYASEHYCGKPENVIPALTVCCTINTGAVMIYMGQELGEPATDAEGYSGADGRTTIFDYWSLDTLRRWLNHGRPGLTRLTDGEKDLRAIYARMLGLVNECGPLRDGSFFDLMYVNYHNNTLDPHRHYAFVRSDTTETALVVLNFGESDAEMDVNVPTHLFDTLNIPRYNGTARELLSRQRYIITFTDETPTHVSVKAHNAAILIFPNKPSGKR